MKSGPVLVLIVALLLLWLTATGKLDAWIQLVQEGDAFTPKEYRQRPSGSADAPAIGLPGLAALASVPQYIGDTTTTTPANPRVGGASGQGGQFWRDGVVIV